MLLQLRDFIQQEGVVSLQQLARRFRTDEYALQPMLDIWVQKGIIRIHENQKGCASHCRGCKSSMPITYEIC